MSLKLFSFSLLSVISFSAFSNDACIKLISCARKSCEIEQQILQAEKTKNKRQIDGLTKALDAVKKDCTEDKLLLEKANKVEAKTKEVAERAKELDEAKKSGKADKIKKHELKLEESKKELDELRASSL